MCCRMFEQHHRSLGLTLLRMISGARYSGVPHSVQVLPFTLLANPKSVTWEGGARAQAVTRRGGI